jgi:predicted DNA-binding antitoxin AbrB/MazE fold protein
MSQEFEAIYDHGILRPIVPLSLFENARVKVTIDATPSVQADAEESGSYLNKEGGSKTEAADSGSDFDAQLSELLFDGPTLPPGFSRADIYADHD